ncbi:ATP-binding protein [Arvimicrobium flavum]|uniref:ATP-binding protein n=1 Tax=Arvimicrobium flavum TaxID=3393320 RepID=UPI00237C491C|nr:ATP-binding protein [Mesorhizobium shangrilense]
MTFGLRSLTLRVIALSTLWAVLSLIVISTIITTLYRQSSERGFDSVLSAHLFHLIGSVGVSESGFLTGSPDLGDLRFSEPQSGWYWSVEPVSGGLKGTLRSPSMTEIIPSPDTAEVPFNANFQRNYVTQGINGEEIEVFENEFVLDTTNRVARFRVMGNRTELENEIDGFERRLFVYLAMFGLGMIAINALAILLGLQPLRRVSDALAQVREGTAKRLTGTFPAEIEPLANETNALIDNNRRIVERARTQVGNLAHSLKTPLAVMLNESRSIGGDRGKLLAGQASAMQNQLDHYLQRARVAAQRDSVVYRTPVVEALTSMARVIQKLKPEISVAFVHPKHEILFGGERADLEEIVGNLLENASKWGRRDVRLSIETPPGERQAKTFQLLVEDDGPGIPEEMAKKVLRRGTRLDEKTPGTGLGLAIVNELVREYGGNLTLGRSDLGGLKVTVELSAAS